MEVRTWELRFALIVEVKLLKQRFLSTGYVMFYKISGKYIDYSPQ